MKVTSFRRQIVMATLLGLAVVGAVIRYTADNPSLLRDVGTLLMVLWLPAVGNLVAFGIRKLPRRARPAADFVPGTPFTGHIRAELIPYVGPAAPRLNLDPLERRCTLIAGGEGFTARLALPVPQWLAAGTPQTLEIEFLRPSAALQRLPPNAKFHVLVGTTPVGSGRVLPKA